MMLADNGSRWFVCTPPDRPEQANTTSGFTFRIASMPACTSTPRSRSARTSDAPIKPCSSVTTAVRTQCSYSPAVACFFGGGSISASSRKPWMSCVERNASTSL